VASARLKSCIAVDSTCWSSLAQGKLRMATYVIFVNLSLDLLVIVGWIVLSQINLSTISNCS
jgi:hypothetical protein